MFVIRIPINTKRRMLRFGATVFAVTVMLPTTNLPAMAQSEASDWRSRESRIEGSWILAIDRINQGTSFTALMSFTGGGVALATGSKDRLPPPPISPLYGSWKAAGPNRAVSTLNFFIFDAQGNPVAMLKNHISFHLDDQDNLEGSGVAFACSVEGENCVSAAGFEIKIKGKRIVPEGVQE